MSPSKQGAKRALLLVITVLLGTFLSMFCFKAYLALRGSNPLFSGDAPAAEILRYARQLWIEKDNVRDALRLCEEVARRHPDSFEAHRLIAVLNADAGVKRYDKALAAARHAAHLRPEDALSYFTLGLVYRDMGRYEVALGHFRKALRARRPPNRQERGVIYSAISITLLQQGKFREGFWYAREASRVSPSEWKFTRVAGCYLYTGNLPLAERYCKMALQYDASYDEAHLYLGDVYARQGREVAALRHWLWAVRYGRGEVRSRGWQNIGTSVEDPSKLWALWGALVTAFPIAALMVGMIGVLAALWLSKALRRLCLQSERL